MWSKHWNRVRDLVQSQHAWEYDIPIPPQPKERGRGSTPLKTRTWESLVSEGIEAQIPPRAIETRLGLEVLFLINSKTPPRHDLSNAIKTLEDAFNRRAYKDDSQIDYLSGLRVWSPDVPNRIEARIYDLEL